MSFSEIRADGSVWLPMQAPTPVDLQGLTVPAMIDLRASQQPFRIALSAQSVEKYRDRLSFSQLALYQRRVGAGLALLGVQPKDRVAVYLGNDAGREAVLTALGCLALGALVVPVNTRSADDELRQALSLVRPRFIVTTSAGAERLRRVTSTTCVLVDPSEAHAPNYGDLTAWPEPTRTAEVLAPTAVSPEDPASLLFTSGTTSKPKAVVHSHRSMLHAGLAMGGSVGIGTGDLYQGAFPFFTSSCLNLGCMSSWVHGAGFVMEHDIDSSQRLRLIEAECTTIYHGVPSLVRFMLDAFGKGKYDVGRVRRIAYGGAPMPAHAIEQIASTWPWMEQVHVWGMTESGPAGAWLPPRWLPGKAGSIGMAMSNCKLAVVDGAGESVNPGLPGELLFRGPSMALGYFDDPAATAETFHDGWLRTGDIVVMDSDGLLRFVDRRKDLINRGGFKVSSAAVEAVLLPFPGVADVAVVAIPCERLGEEIAACLVAAPGVNLSFSALNEWCRSRLADYEVPRHWHLFDALPRNPMGKVLKRELREMLCSR